MNLFIVENHEVITIRPEKELFGQLAQTAAKYAVISIPFTINRMEIPGIEQRISNVFKGKLAEFILCEFLNKQGANISTAGCSTPFYQSDKRDFIYNDFEYDLKNNFIHSEHLPDFSRLPALVPDRGIWDQWEKRSVVLHSSCKGVRFLFAFILLNLSGKENPFLIPISNNQKILLAEIHRQYKGKEVISPPFTETDFWQEFESFGKVDGCKSFEKVPEMILTAWAGEEHWSLFEKHPPRTYQQKIIKTRITNRACALSKLPSAKTLFEI